MQQVWTTTDPSSYTGLTKERFSRMLTWQLSGNNFACEELQARLLVVYAIDFVWALFMWTLYMDFVCDLDIYFEWSLFLLRMKIRYNGDEDKYYSSCKFWYPWWQKKFGSTIEKVETKFWILLDCLLYGQRFTDASITTSLCWARCARHFYVFTRRWYDIQGCNGCLNHFEPEKNVVFERHVFRQAMQVTNESLLTFVTRLCKLAPTCEFSNPNSEIHDQFIDKCSSNRLRHRLLQEPNLTLENVFEKA